MRTMLLSLRPDVYENVASGLKIFEHRKVFPDEPIKAYIYISRPVQAIAGIMILDNKTPLESWKEEFIYDKEAIIRINDYLTRNKFAMQIKYFQDTNRIPLATLRNFDPKFLIPQLYYYLDNSELLSFIEDNLVAQGDPTTHDFTTITSNMVCQY